MVNEGRRQAASRFRIVHEAEEMRVGIRQGCGGRSEGGGDLFWRLLTKRRSGRVQNVIFSIKVIVEADKRRRAN